MRTWALSQRKLTSAARFMHASCARIARNEEQRSPSCSKVSQKESLTLGTHACFSIVDHPSIYELMDISNLDFSLAFNRAIRPDPLLYVTLDHFVKNVIMKLSLACMWRVMYEAEKKLMRILQYTNDWLK